MAIFAALLVIAVGPCVLDHDSDGGGEESVDVCLAVVAAVVAVQTLVIILAAGWSVLDVRPGVSPATPRLPDPPPKCPLFVW